MEKLKIELENCYGIGEMEAEFTFGNGNGNGNSSAVYAPNGTMKTSFARTLDDFSHGTETTDLMFPERTSVRSICDQDGKELDAESVVVIKSYDEELGPTESTSTLLVNPTLRTEYEELQRELLGKRDQLVAELKKQSGTKEDVVKIISRVFAQQDDHFFPALSGLSKKIEEKGDILYVNVPYDLFFNSKVKTILSKRTIQSALSDYVSQLNALLEESTFFSRCSFNFYNATNVIKSLDDNGFFAAEHSVLLRDKKGCNHEFSKKTDLSELIAREKERITRDDSLRKKFESIEKELQKNSETRAFSEYIAENEKLLPELIDLDSFERNLWESYIKAHEKLYMEVLERFKNIDVRKKEIEKEAVAEHTQWQKVINVFNDRFFVPFRLIATNREKVVLGQEKILKLDFQFNEGPEEKPVKHEELLKVLSEGEKKALYVLNVLFEVEVRRSSGHDTLFIIDDIADSFDYKNKYAIVHYLKEVSDYKNLKFIFLTHNFDFFRTLQGRGVVGYDRCFMAEKSKTRVTLNKAVGVKNPFNNDFKLNFFKNEMRRVACIPFLRNIIEYTKGTDDPDYLKLTSLLHWKKDTDTITQSDLDCIFKKTFISGGVCASEEFSRRPKEKVGDFVIAQADLAVDASESANLANKIVLAIAARLLSEKHMIAELDSRGFTDGINSKQTYELLKAYRERDLGDIETLRTLDKVVLMTSETIHLNSFMYEPIIDMSDDHLRKLYRDVKEFCGRS